LTCRRCALNAPDTRSELVPIWARVGAKLCLGFRFEQSNFR